MYIRFFWRLLGSFLVSDSIVLGWSLSICISNSLLGDADAAVQRLFETHAIKPTQLTGKNLKRWTAPSVREVVGKQEHSDTADGSVIWYKYFRERADNTE